jgi:capsular polysaccharide biosynthesis protein
VKDNGQAAVPSLNGGNDLPERLWAYDDFAAIEDRPADFATGLVSLAFLKAAIRRGRRLWCTTAAIGFLIACGLYASAPATYQATTSVLLTYGPYEDGSTAATDEAAIGQSRTVAGIAVSDLRLPESAAGVLANYTVVDVSPRVLTITYTAPSSSEAVTMANAVAKAFLQFRVHQLQSAQQLVVAATTEDIRRTRQRISTITAQTRYWRAQPPSPAQRARLSSLQTELGDAQSALTSLQQSLDSAQDSTATALAERGSQVLDPAAPVHHSRFKPLISRALIGLIGGFALGLAIVVVRALLSDRLRRREDVAHALGAPVKLSVGAVHLSRWRPGRRGLEAARGAEIRQIVAHLASNVRPDRRGVAALGIVPVDELEVAAVSVASLALSCAQQGQQVLVADLCPGAPAARLLGGAKPGVRGVRLRDTYLVLAVPDRDEVLPAGPLELTAPPGQQPSFTGAVAEACASADLLLTLIALDPSLGSENLATWATDVVALVTAGKSSATRLHGVGEMIRLAGVPLASVVLVGADKTDESLGVTHPSRTDRRVRAARG